ncbi:MAG: hypothetical protein ACI909_002850 [Planctomycetota bacterium]|jgi:hypothetical protein
MWIDMYSIIISVSIGPAFCIHYFACPVVRLGLPIGSQKGVLRELSLVLLTSRNFIR